MSPRSRPEAPIGVFDSGVGGLTVLRALRAHLPAESFIYLGDTARLPYGTKSPASIERYSLQAADALVRLGIKCLVVACNTASAVALGALQRKFASIPVIGVVEPGAQAACAASRSGVIAVIATESTVRGGAYQRAIHSLRPDATVHARACQLFVALAEEGWTDGPIVEAVARRYLDPLCGPSGSSADTLLLGCTHFPALRGAMRQVLDADVKLVDSAQATAEELQRQLKAHDAFTRTVQPQPARFLATDGPERFARVGSRFLGETIDSAEVEVIDLSEASQSPLAG